MSTRCVAKGDSSFEDGNSAIDVPAASGQRSGSVAVFQGISTGLRAERTLDQERVRALPRGAGAGAPTPPPMMDRGGLPTRADHPAAAPTATDRARLVP